MIQSKYITLDEFTEYFPEIDIIGAFGTEEKALAFIKRIEDRMETFIAANFDKNVEWIYPRFTDYQKKHYKRALLEQAIYIFKNSDLSVDSGYDLDRGVVADIETLKKLAIAPNAKEELLLCGLWSRHLRGTGWNDIWGWLK